MEYSKKMSYSLHAEMMKKLTCSMAEIVDLSLKNELNLNFKGFFRLDTYIVDQAAWNAWLLWQVQRVTAHH